VADNRSAPTGLFCVFEYGQPNAETLAPTREAAVERWRANRSDQALGWRTLEYLGQIKCAPVRIVEAS
jgi:hypothetical protein